ncbi:MAG: glutaredoxin family protein [Gammaproteobacteria bacterium]|nr:glutaredoxin family protein [Gammaproteobacteria bacterium]
MPTFTLYATSGCHLCEQACALLNATKQDLDFVEIDICTDEILLSRYGESIPVLQNNQTGEALYWPFVKKQIERFIE